MLINIDASNGLAIYDQVVRQIKYAVANGTIREGELVPSVRELARDLAINPNTVARAYQQLQSGNVLDSVRGTGLIVKKSATAKCRKERVALLRQRLREVFREAKQSRLDFPELKSLVDEELEKVNSVRPSNGESE